MKRLMIGLVLAVFLVGCGGKPEFSINENDTLETYANNPAFIKVVSDLPDKGTVYKFIGAPTSVYQNIKTNDLDVLGGYVIIDNKDSKKRSFALTLKGKASFDKIMDRLNQGGYIQDMNCMKTGMEKGNHFICNNSETRIFISNNYNPFTDSTVFYINYF